MTIWVLFQLLENPLSLRCPYLEAYFIWVCCFFSMQNDDDGDPVFHPDHPPLLPGSGHDSRGLQMFASGPEESLLLD